MMEPGTIILDRYRVEHELGRGAFGVVYRGVSLASGEAVAIKIMDPKQTQDPSGGLRFRQEGRHASKVVHPNAVRVLEFAELGDVCFLIMEMLEGQTLGAQVEASLILPASRVTEIGRDTAAALAAAHAVNIIHRDIKPDNIFLHQVNGREVVKVLDFGVAKATDDLVQTLTLTGAVVGTPLYISPERMRGESFDGRSDVFGLGVTLYRCLSGERPFARGSSELIDIVLAILHDEPLPLSPAAPPALSSLILSAMEKNVSNRPTADELHLALCDL